MVASYSFPARRSMPAPIWAPSRRRWRADKKQRRRSWPPDHRSSGDGAARWSQHARQDEIGDELSLARQQPAVFAPQQPAPTEVHLRQAGLSVRHRVAESSTLIYERRGDAGRHGPSRPSPHVVGDLREVGGQIQAAPKLVLNHRISLLSPQCGGTLVPKTRENRRKRKCPT